MYYMKVIMDADCLIKLTKAGLKEDVCHAFTIIIPRLVKEDVVDRGKTKELPDALVIDDNVHDGLIKVQADKTSKATAGEKEALTLFQKGGFDAIGSDDKRFIRQLRIFNIPYLTPAVFIALMVRQGNLKTPEALRKLDALSEHISDDEYATVKLFLDSRRSR
jgi:hypothetical protein